ncbi:MAG: CoA ester lyase [Caulobacteraceae bacterium]|nr:CoA ester lyase [Caulobacteraceae bacterium]
MPASNARAIEKARALPCDAVILDLEDAVAPDAKDAARAQAAAAIGEGGFGRREVILRVNGRATPWGEADLAAAAKAGPDAVLVPKVDDAADLEAYDQALADAPAKTRLWAMIETGRAILGLREIAGAAARTRLTTLCVGGQDLGKEMRARHTPDRAPLHAALALTVTAARAYGLAVLDSVYTDIGNAEGLAAECRQGLEFGFDGKTLIHPSQIEAANRAFSPTPEEIAWARKVRDAFAAAEAAGRGALQVEGRMVERLHLAQALEVLDIAEAVAEAAP